MTELTVLTLLDVAVGWPPERRNAREI